ncbi:MAG: HgcAB-associated protein HgcC [Halobacteriota archaeon]
MTDEAICCTSESGTSTCRVEAIVSVDERGQMTLPKELRERADIRAGDKLAVVGCEREGAVCCISLVKVEALSGMVKGMLGPIFAELH